MSNVEKVKQLLDGTLDPAELELDADLYSMAERIYGREALEEMGVSAPERETDTIIKPNGDSSHDVQIPTPMPLPPVNGSQKSGRDWFRGLLLISGLLGFLTVLYNTFFGIGEIYEFCINTSGTSGVCGSIWAASKVKALKISIRRYPSQDFHQAMPRILWVCRLTRQRGWDRQ